MNKPSMRRQFLILEAMDGFSSLGFGASVAAGAAGFLPFLPFWAMAGSAQAVAVSANSKFLVIMMFNCNDNH